MISECCQHLIHLLLSEEIAWFKDSCGYTTVTTFYTVGCFVEVRGVSDTQKQTQDLFQHKQIFLYLTKYKLKASALPSCVMYFVSSSGSR